MSCLGERVPSRRVRCVVLFQSVALPSEALRIRRRAIIDVLESQRLGQEPLLQRGADRAFDILPHCAEAQRIPVFAEERRLFLPICAREVEIGLGVAPARS